MLRITIQESAQASTFKLEGKLTGPWVRELEQAWTSATPGHLLTVDLADVTFIDCAGKDLLARMHEGGATLIAHSPMNRSIVDEIARVGKHVLVVLLVGLAAAAGRAQDPAQSTVALRLTLRDAVQLALNQNPQVQVANLNVAQSQQDQALARAGLLPQASFQAYEQTRRFPVATLFGQQSIPFLPLPGHLGPYQVDQAGPNFSVPIFDLTLWRRWQASKEGVGTSRAQNQGVREQIAMLVVSQYLGSLRASADVKAAQSRVDLAQALYDQAADMQKNGVGTGIDTLRANVELQNERQRLIESQTQFQTSLYGLAQLLNVDPRRDIALTDQVSFFDTPAIEVDRSLEAAYTNRPEMKALLHVQRQVELAKQQAGESRYPTLSFDGYWAEQGLTPATAIPAYTFGFNLNVPLYTGGRIGAERAKADLELRKVSQQEQEQRNQIALQVRTAIAQMAAARSEVDVANQAVSLANEEVTQARDRFQAGVANNIEVISAQDALARANDNQIVALYRYNQARADLARATGQMEAVYAK
ncbi:MAG: TolC family protein [Bryobacteraceae bacterium]|jgi:outer membrane protein TolC/ABC-type transporter Mla MlaB component